MLARVGDAGQGKGQGHVSPYLLFGQIWSHARILDPIPALDHVGLEGYRSRAVVELEEQAACVAKHGAELISSPERGGRGAAIVAGRLRSFAIMVSRGCHHDECRLSKREKDLRKFGGVQGAFMYCGGISSGLIRF